MTDPRYATVLNFERCEGISLEGIQMGHTFRGSCWGNVLGFSACRDVTITGMDLYGCGVYGIDTQDGTAGLTVADSIIRDCEYGPFWLTGGEGRFEFRNCALTGSEGFGYYEGETMELAFYDCSFGYYETSAFLFADDVYTENCVWSEDYFYPEYSGGFEDYDPADFDLGSAEVVQADRWVLMDHVWQAYYAVDPKTGETSRLPRELPDGGTESVTLTLDDGFGLLERGGAQRALTWEMDDSAYFAELTAEDGEVCRATTYAAWGEGHVWLLLQTEEANFWLY